MQKKKKTFTGFCVPPPLLLLLLPPPAPEEGLGKPRPRPANRPGLPASSGGRASEWQTAAALGGVPSLQYRPLPSPSPGGLGARFPRLRWSPAIASNDAPGCGGKLKGFALPDPGRRAWLGRGRRAPWAHPRFRGWSPGGRTRWFEKVAGVAEGGGKVSQVQPTKEPGV